ncbi:uncharacterized protein [Hetaerina americana]|uniref:uncharacterized protein n=1 Tax=Hetaerina americana TaxID=62018 RepID=UPI003A7F1C67
MAKVFFSLVVAVLVAVGAQANIKDQCSWFVGKHPFEEKRMEGIWHVIASASNHPDITTRTCARYNITYKKSDDDTKFIVKLSGLDKERKLMSFEGISRPKGSERRSMFLGVLKKIDSETYDGVYKEAILVSDYDTYAAYIGCRPTFDPVTNEFGRRYMAAVVSRKPTLSEDIKNTLINVFSGYNIDPSEFKHVEHKDCHQ